MWPRSAPWYFMMQKGRGSMFEVLARDEPLPETPFVGRDVKLSAAPRFARFSLRARKSADLERSLGRPVPAKIGESDQGLLCLGPDEWLLVAPVGTSLSQGAGVAVTDVSDRNVAILLEGARATEVLSAGCPLDLAHFAVGRATRTIFETVEIIVVRDAADRFHIEVWRSFAPWLWTAFETVAIE